MTGSCPTSFVTTLSMTGHSEMAGRCIWVARSTDPLQITYLNSVVMPDEPGSNEEDGEEEEESSNEGSSDSGDEDNA
jgi:hypothetical protein